MKICLVGAEFFYVDCQTDMMNRTVAFRNFVNEPKISSISLLPLFLCLHCCNTVHANCLQSSIADAFPIRGEHRRLNAWNYMSGN